MAGETGERVGGVVGLFGVLLSVTGLVLWWPARKRFGVRNLAPSGTSRRAMLHWHRDLGVVATPMLLVLLLSGSGLVFYNAAGGLLGAIFFDPAPADPGAPAILPARTPVGLADAAILERVREEFPGARLVFYYPPRDGATVHEFRLKQPCELHPNGRSYLDLDAAGKVVRKVDACGIPAGQEVLHALYPLHSGKMPSGLYRFATFLGGIMLAGLAVSGVWAYGRKVGG